MKSPALLARVVLAPGVLNAAEAETLRRRLPSDAPGDVREQLLSELDRGEVQCCRMLRDGVPLGFIVYATFCGELIVHAAIGNDGHENLIGDLAGDNALIVQLARQCACEVVRFHTIRPGLVAKAMQYGFHVSEVVMRKKVL